MTILRHSSLALLVAACFSGAAAAPTLPQVVNGQATFSQQGNVFSITNTPNTIINWQSFSVNAGEITRFIQQNENSAVLNRILGQDPSQILGALQSNGRVFLINPNGVLFGRDSRVDVNGLVASTLNLSNADFLAGKKNFTAGATAGNVSNQGAITTASGGQVFLIAPNVENSGVITSPKGEVVLAAGHTVQLVDSANPDLHVVVSAPASQAINLGQVIAQGGKVGIYGALVNQRGVVNANSAVVGENGKIVFKASGDTLLEAGSVTSATGAGKGGEIQVLGARVGLTGNAQVDASGNAGGGTVLVGGDYQGKNPLVKNAKVTYFGTDATIRADAIDSGDGGKVVLWSDNIARVYGSISTRGGAAGGDGGFVETSGKLGLDFRAKVDTGAPRGKAGNLLLDPLNITIVDSGGLNDIEVLDNGVSLLDLPGTSFTISRSALEALSGNITLVATGDITFSNLASDKLDLANVGSGSTFSLTAGGDLIATADILDRVVTAGGNVSLAAGGLLNIGGVRTYGGQITMSAGGNLTAMEVNSHPTGAAQGGVISLTSGGSMSLGGGGHVDARHGDCSCADGNVTLNSGGAISVSTTSVVYANNLRLTANGGIYGSTSADPMSIHVPYLNAINSGSGNMRLKSLYLATLEIKDIGAVGYGLKQDGAGNTGSIYLTTSTTSPLLISAGVSTVNGNFDATFDNIDVAVGSALSSTAGSISLNSQSLSIEGGVTVGSGDIELTSPTGGSGINLGVGSSLRSAGHINVTADSIALSGTMGSASATLPLVHFNTQTASANIDISDNDPDSYMWLAPAGLAAISATEIRIGSSAHTGQLRFDDAFTAAAGKLTTLTLESSGSILLGSTIDLSANPNTIFMATNYGAANLSVNGSGLIKAKSIALRSDKIDLTGSLNATGGSVSLSPYDAARAIDVGGAANDAGTLAITATELGHITAKSLTIGGNSGQSGGMNVLGPVIVANLDVAGTIKLDGGTGALALGSSDIHAPTLLLNGHGIEGTALLHSPTIVFTSTGGIGNLTAPVDTIASSVTASNNNPSGVAPINIRNNNDSSSGTLTLGNITQSGAGNTGSISIDNRGGIVVPSSSAIAAGSGAISLLAHSPLTINGSVVTNSGNITLTATGGVLTVGSTGAVLSSSGNIALVGSSVVQLGTVSSSSGSVTGALTLAQCISNPSLPGCGALLPSLSACISNPTTPGCLGVLPDLDTCVSAPSTPGCAVVLPGLGNCISAPTTDGCSAVLPALASCVSAPTTAGCSAVLPSLASCVTAPTAVGCSVVLPTLASCIGAPTTVGCTVVLPGIAACTANPSAPGCIVVLPTLALCVTAPTTAGCSAVLPTLASCIAAPTSTGCTVVLPTLASCITTPTAQGCSVVLPSLPSCIASPTIVGCSVVLPSLPICIGSPSKTGCNVVLPTMAACIAAPTTIGCSAVLPSLSQCIATPTAAGCTIVLPSLPMCIATPSAQGCTVVLPTLGQCTSRPTQDGCTVVLPTLQQCMASPTLQGCTVVLPTLVRCAVVPSEAGCSVVLPSASFCSANPSEAICIAMSPPTAPKDGEGNTPIGLVINAMISLINAPRSATMPLTATLVPVQQTTSGGASGPSDQEKSMDSMKDKTADGKSPANDKIEVKNEPTKKLYCN